MSRHRAKCGTSEVGHHEQDPAPRGIYPMLYAFFDAAGDWIGGDAAPGRGVRTRKVRTAWRCSAWAQKSISCRIAERRQLVEWVAEDLAGRLPLAVTVSRADRRRAGRVSRDTRKQHGASWVILQPPPERGCRRGVPVSAFFGAVAARGPMPVCHPECARIHRRRLAARKASIPSRAIIANFRILKGEGPVLTIRRVIEAAGALRSSMAAADWNSPITCARVAPE